MQSTSLFAMDIHQLCNPNCIDKLELHMKIVLINNNLFTFEQGENRSSYKQFKNWRVMQNLTLQT